MRQYTIPDNEEAKQEIKKALKKNEMITLYCNCSVHYKGRAESKLENGDRVILIKPDKTLLVHKPEGRNPINWMAERSSIKTSINGGILELTAENINPRESMKISINEVHMLSAKKMIDGIKPKIIGTEADMARMIYDKPTLISNDFIPASLEEQTKYGFIDVMGHNGKGSIIIIECKRYKADLNTIQQLRRYAERIKKSKGTNNIKGIIAAPKITKNAEIMAKDWGFEFIKIDPPKYLEIDKARQNTLNKY